MNIILKFNWLVKRQNCDHIESSLLICRANSMDWFLYYGNFGVWQVCQKIYKNSAQIPDDHRKSLIVKIARTFFKYQCTMDTPPNSFGITNYVERRIN